MRTSICERPSRALRRDRRRRSIRCTAASPWRRRSASEAVESTRTLVLKYAGPRRQRAVLVDVRRIDRGGIGDLAIDDEPYLQRVSDQIPGTDRYYCDIAPRFRWTRTLDGPHAERRARAVSRELRVGARTPPGVARASRSDRAHRRGESARYRHDRSRATSPCAAMTFATCCVTPGGEILNSTYFSVESDARRSDGAIGETHVDGDGLRTWRRHVPVGRHRTRASRSGLSHDSSHVLSRHDGWSAGIAGVHRRRAARSPSCALTVVAAAAWRAHRTACFDQAQPRQAADPCRSAWRSGAFCRRRSEPTTSDRAFRPTTARSAPRWRVVFGVSYWESRFEDDVVQAFVDSLQQESQSTRRVGSSRRRSRSTTSRSASTCGTRRRTAASSSRSSASALPRTW